MSRTLTPASSCRAPAGPAWGVKRPGRQGRPAGRVARCAGKPPLRLRSGPATAACWRSPPPPATAAPYPAAPPSRPAPVGDPPPRPRADLKRGGRRGVGDQRGGVLRIGHLRHRQGQQHRHQPLPHPLRHRAATTTATPAVPAGAPVTPSTRCAAVTATGGRGGRYRYRLLRVIPVLTTIWAIESPASRRCTAYASTAGSSRLGRPTCRPCAAAAACAVPGAAGKPGARGAGRVQAGGHRPIRTRWSGRDREARRVGYTSDRDGQAVRRATQSHPAVTGRRAAA